jgi:hypothetical protein
MADLKISQLPLFPATGDTTGFFVVANNTGETITYKMTKETLIGASGSSGTSGTSGTSGSNGTSGTSGVSGSSGSSGTSGSSGSSGTSGSSGSSGTSGSSGSSGTSGSSGSSGTSGSSGDSFFIPSNTTNSFVNDWYSSGATDGIQQFILGGSGNTITHQDRTLAIINSEGSIIRDPGEVGFIKTIVGAQNSTIQGGAIGVGIFGGRNHLNYAGDGGVLVGGFNNQLNGGQNNAIIGGTNNSIPNATASFIAGSESFAISNGVKNIGLAAEAGGYNADMRFGAIIAGYNNTHNANGQMSVIMGGASNDITGSGSYRSFIVGGDNNTINASTDHYYNLILGSNNSTIYPVSSGDDNNSFVSSSYSVISGKTRSSMISTSGQTALYDDTLHTDNHHTFKTESFDVINAGVVSGSINVDLSLGSLYYFEITGNTTPNFINWREGQQIQFWVFNNGSHSVPTATISGGGDVYAKAGSLNPSNNERTGYYGTIVNGDLYLDEHLNFQAL